MPPSGQVRRRGEKIIGMVSSPLGGARCLVMVNCTGGLLRMNLFPWIAGMPHRLEKGEESRGMPVRHSVRQMPARVPFQTSDSEGSSSRYRSSISHLWRNS